MMVKKIPGKEATQESQNEHELENILTEEEQATEELKPNENEEFVDDQNMPRQENKNITDQQLIYFSEKIAPDWPKLAVKLGMFLKNFIVKNCLNNSYPPNIPNSPSPLRAKVGTSACLFSALNIF